MSVFSELKVCGFPLIFTVLCTHMNIRCQFNRLEREMKKICRNINMQMEWMSIRCRGRAYAFYFHVEKNVLARSQEHVNRFTLIDIELGEQATTRAVNKRCTPFESIVVFIGCTSSI